MTYVEGFLVAVRTANKDAYREHAERSVSLFKEFGAARLVEGWGDDVPRGKRNDLYGAVAAEEGETVLFSWFEYPDRATRDAANEKIMADPRMKAMGADMPFDGKRMVWGGFESVADVGTPGGAGYIDGVVLPLPAAARDEYRRFCSAVAPVFLEYGATRVMDAVADDVQDGKVTDFNRAILREEGEVAAFGWVEWPDKAARDAGWEKVMADPRMTGEDAPFDGKRMIFGGFVPLLDA
ncbi:DUF1428 domain-containing protein [Sphingomonas sp. Y38-1Y]|uniref:DUF1428 domain-containing protein n=1 Tax=Sphingomonas sp. Y38-1Y TaxID=3078265 RepID=UPI00396487AA